MRATHDPQHLVSVSADGNVNDRAGIALAALADRLIPFWSAPIWNRLKSDTGLKIPRGLPRVSAACPFNRTFGVPVEKVIDT
jgi:hypothetical protein